jgi:hypothetical protein
MFILLLVLAIAEPASPSPDAQSVAAGAASATAPPHAMTRQERYEARMNQVRCHPIETLSGIAQKVCVTNRDWARRQRENEQQVSDFQTRSLASPY